MYVTNNDQNEPGFHNSMGPFGHQEFSICSSYSPLGDWSLSTGRWGGGLQNGKIAGPKLFAPPPPSEDRVKLFMPPF